MKYRPDFPASFENLQAARTWCREFFDYYNDRRRNSGVGLFTPAVVHRSQAAAAWAARAAVRDAAYAEHPERFVRRAPAPPALSEPVWINRSPEEEQPDQTDTSAG